MTENEKLVEKINCRIIARKLKGQVPSTSKYFPSAETFKQWAEFFAGIFSSLAESEGLIRIEDVEIDADELGLVLYDISREGGFKGITCKVMADRIAQAKDILKLKEPNDEKEKVS